MDQRDEEIWRLRKEGATFSQIAKRFDISSGRVQQICCRRQDRIDNFDKWPPLKKLLPVRVQNVLIKAFGNEEILKNPERLASMGHDVFLTWRNLGRKSAKALVDALESLGYTVSRGTMMTDPICELIQRIGRSILRKYFDYYTKNSLDDVEYIPVVRLIIEGIAEEMGSSGMLEPNCKEVAEKLKAFNCALYQNVWIGHAKEDEDPDEEPFNLKKEDELAKYTFDYIYKHRKHPPNRGF